MGFKVPIGYRELEDKNTEVVYDDGSTWSFGGSGGGEGEDEMFKIIRDSDGKLDKTYNEIKSAVESGKICCVYGRDDYDSANIVEYVTQLPDDISDNYLVTIWSYGTPTNNYYGEVDGVLTRAYPD